MGRQRVWIPKYEGLERFLQEQLGDREHRLLVKRLEGAIKAMETIASMPELAREWKGGPSVTPAMPAHVRAAFEGMIASYFDDEERFDEARATGHAVGAAGTRGRPAGDHAHGPLQRVRAGGIPRRTGGRPEQADRVQVGTNDGRAHGAGRQNHSASSKAPTLTLVVGARRRQQ